MVNSRDTQKSTNQINNKKRCSSAASLQYICTKLHSELSWFVNVNSLIILIQISKITDYIFNDKNPKMKIAKQTRNTLLLKNTTLIVCCHTYRYLVEIGKLNVGIQLISELFLHGYLLFLGLQWIKIQSNFPLLQNIPYVTQTELCDKTK